MTLPEGLHWRSDDSVIYLENEDGESLIKLRRWHLPGVVTLTIGDKKVESYIEDVDNYTTWIEHLFTTAVLVSETKTRVVGLQLNT